MHRVRLGPHGQAEVPCGCKITGQWLECAFSWGVLTFLYKKICSEAYGTGHLEESALAHLGH